MTRLVVVFYYPCYHGKLMWLHLKAVIVLFNNGNWTEWSAIWSEIIRVISKLNEPAARIRFEITSMISDQNQLHDLEVNYPFITSILPAMWFVTLNKIWNLFGCAVLVFLFHSLGERCDLEQKLCDLGINHTAESQSDWTDCQWFQSGCNKGL